MTCRRPLAAICSGLWLAVLGGCSGKPPTARAAATGDRSEPPTPPETAPPPLREEKQRTGAAAEAGGRAVAVPVPELIGLLKARKELQALTPESAARRFARLAPRFSETTTPDDERRDWEGGDDEGFVRRVAFTFVPAASGGEGGWRFQSVSVRLHPDDPRRTFAEIRQVATASLKKARWVDLGERDRQGWSLGESWELVAATLEDGDIQLRAGRPPKP